MGSRMIGIAVAAFLALASQSALAGPPSAEVAAAWSRQPQRLAASAATTVSGPNPDIAQGTAFAPAIGPANVRVTITETVAGDVFGPGKTGTIRVNLGNIGVLNGVGQGPAPCAGTLSLTGSGPVVITITAAPASMPSGAPPGLVCPRTVFPKNASPV